MTELSKELTDMLETLGSHGKDPAGGVSRFLYTEEWVAAQKYLEKEMVDEGLDVHFDEIGNLFGTLKGSKYPNETILSGSHVDTVGNGGYYDGQFGIVAAFIAIKHLKAKYGQPLRNIEVVSMAEEEGSRFPYSFWGSKNIVGIAKNDDVRNITDFDGVPFVEAMHKAGFDFRDDTKGMREDFKAFVEIHNEQGNVLETEEKSVGVVHSIVGQRRFNIEISGQANHAGTTPMGYRKDTVFATSQMVSEIITAARKHGDPLVATVGKIEVTPNVVNVVPGNTLFTLDIRHTEKDALVQFTEEVYEILNRLAQEHQVGLNIDMWMDEDPVPMDKNIVDLMIKQCEENGLNYKLMHSGAGHDSQIFAPKIPTAMIFVPSRDGISHNPAEYTEPADLAEGVKALMGALYELAYKE
ncbi:allantoate deiminase [Oceanobacillus profundus]|uniref:Allantoate amidohydrolase n=1 Tax=Oceanobacillus profundus TaxID=372463 RepID=A0A417YE32_9BACI|nr:allantoate deiminase [Oceanobacillus profundus]MDO6448542.1 allantoate deiminase [Oceanobacillus profundus]RHW30851.1 allantoate amidohydrolase [Oceanobacillus profundus]